MRDKICIACGKALLKRPLIVLDGMPASAQDIPDAEGRDEDKGISRICTSAISAVWCSLTVSLSAIIRT